METKKNYILKPKMDVSKGNKIKDQFDVLNKKKLIDSAFKRYIKKTEKILQFHSTKW